MKTYSFEFKVSKPNGRSKQFIRESVKNGLLYDFLSGMLVRHLETGVLWFGGLSFKGSKLAKAIYNCLELRWEDDDNLECINILETMTYTKHKRVETIKIAKQALYAFTYEEDTKQVILWKPWKLCFRDGEEIDLGALQHEKDV